MRLNFSGSTEEEIREGVRRIGEVIAEQVALYETITGEHESAGPPNTLTAPGREAEDAADDDEGGDVVPIRPRR
jgi:2-aminoadipate transaminase